MQVAGGGNRQDGEDRAFEINAIGQAFNTPVEERAHRRQDGKHNIGTGNPSLRIGKPGTDVSCPHVTPLGELYYFNKRSFRVAVDTPEYKR